MWTKYTTCDLWLITHAWIVANGCYSLSVTDVQPERSFDLTHRHNTSVDEDVYLKSRDILLSEVWKNMPIYFQFVWMG